MPPALEAIAPLGVEPISPEAPAGASIQDEFEFDQLQTDVQALLAALGTTAEMKAIGDREAPTWERVADRAFALLKEKSRDIRLACFLTVAMMQTRGFEGLAPCLQMLDGLLRNFWETMYPPLKLLRGRINALDFIATQVAGESDAPGGRIALHKDKLLDAWNALLETNPPASQKQEMLEQIERQTAALRACSEHFGKMREVIYEKIPADKLPSMSSLTDATKAALAELEEFVQRNKPAEPAAAGAAPAGVASAAAPRPAAPAAAMAGSLDSIDEVRRIFGRCAGILRQAASTDPAGYRLARWAVWQPLTAAPPTKDGVHTMIPDVQRAEADQARALLSSSNWIQLLNASEERMGMTPLWLDRQYHSFMALGGLGPAYQAAREAVRDELAQLLRRVPTLPTLQFAGGMPLADTATQDWINNVVLAGPAGGDGGGGGGGRAMTGADGDGKLGEILEEARTLARDGRVAEALRKLETGPQGMGEGRARFMWRLAQAQVAAEAGKARAMVPFLEHLVEEIDNHRLEQWEPALCEQVYRALLRAAKGDKVYGELGELAFRRLSRLDPAAALELS